jgi:hypothetical protein
MNYQEKAKELESWNTERVDTMYPEEVVIEAIEVVGRLCICGDSELAEYGNHKCHACAIVDYMYRHRRRIKLVEDLKEMGIWCEKVALAKVIAFEDSLLQGKTL